MRAAAVGNAAFVESCLGTPALLHAKDRFGQTATHWAAYRGQIRILRMLVGAAGPRALSERDKDGRTALHWAVRKDRTLCAHYLLREGCPLDRQTKGTGETALHKACRQGNLDIARMLCLAGARRDVCTTHHQSALDIAIEMQALEHKMNNEARPEATGDEKEKTELAAGKADEPEGGDNNAAAVGGAPAASPTSPYPTGENGDAEVEDTNKFGPIVELLQTFTDEMVDPSRIMQDEEGEVAPDGSPKKRKRGKLKKKATLYVEGGPMAEVMEERLRAGKL